MLGAFLDRLTGFFSKYFLLASFFPILIFAFVNGLLLYAHSEAFRALVAGYTELNATVQAFYGFSLLIGLAVLAYLLSAVKLSLQELLEGKHWPEARWFRWLAGEWLAGRQHRRLAEMEARLLDARVNRRQVRNSHRKWRDELAQARRDGKATEQPPPYDPHNSAAARALREVEDRRNRGEPIPPTSLADAVGELAAELRLGDADDPAAAAGALDRDHVRVLRLMQYAEERWDRAYVDRFNERQACFGDGSVRPTRFGNVAETIQSYAATRYFLNLDAFWTRLQQVLQGHEAFYAALQDAKTQLDFTVAMFWLTVGTAGVWFAIFLFMAAGVPVPFLAFAIGGPLLALLPFLAVALAGPALALLWYRLGVTAYVTFAQVVRSAVDLYRFELLRALHVALPADLARERRLWDALNRISAYGERVDLRYEHPESS